MYCVIKKSIETEKALKTLQPLNKYTFVVVKGSTKIDIKIAVEKIYKVKVMSVNKIPTRKKERLIWRWKVITKRKSSIKAIVTLKSWDKIDISEFKNSKTKDGK